MTTYLTPDRGAVPTPLDNRIPPPVVTLLTGLVMGAASLVAPATHLPGIVRYGALGAVMLVGGVFGTRAFIAFAKAKTTINPVDINAASTLVTTGIYGISRNPMYVGLAALLVALALALSNLWLLLGPLFFVAFTTRFQILPEERVMQSKFADYAAYRRRVRRWL
jgi:protein-S-isoprenylcysteine O-methyltransferase Ste14